MQLLDPFQFGCRPFPPTLLPHPTPDDLYPLFAPRHGGVVLGLIEKLPLPRIDLAQLLASSPEYLSLQVLVLRLIPSPPR